MIRAYPWICALVACSVFFPTEARAVELQTSCEPFDIDTDLLLELIHLERRSDAPELSIELPPRSCDPEESAFQVVLRSEGRAINLFVERPSEDASFTRTLALAIAERAALLESSSSSAEREPVAQLQSTESEALPPFVARRNRHSLELLIAPGFRISLPGRAPMGTLEVGLETALDALFRWGGALRGGWSRGTVPAFSADLVVCALEGHVSVAVFKVPAFELRIGVSIEAGVAAPFRSPEPNPSAAPQPAFWFSSGLFIAITSIISDNTALELAIQGDGVPTGIRIAENAATALDWTAGALGARLGVRRAF